MEIEAFAANKENLLNDNIKMMKCSHYELSKELGYQISKIDSQFIKLQSYISRFEQFEQTLFETKKMSLNNSLTLKQLELSKSLSNSKNCQRYSCSTGKCTQKKWKERYSTIVDPSDLINSK